MLRRTARVAAPRLGCTERRVRGLFHRGLRAPLHRQRRRRPTHAPTPFSKRCLVSAATYAQAFRPPSRCFWECRRRHHALTSTEGGAGLECDVAVKPSVADVKRGTPKGSPYHTSYTHISTHSTTKPYLQRGQSRQCAGHAGERELLAAVQHQHLQPRHGRRQRRQCAVLRAVLPMPTLRCPRLSS